MNALQQPNSVKSSSPKYDGDWEIVPANQANCVLRHAGEPRFVDMMAKSQRDCRNFKHYVSEDIKRLLQKVKHILTGEPLNECIGRC
ncbi:hypothetical protein T11_10244 [Trichinella zimbabwensis]|uniref:Uncharacterized protein n=1 Tax=Trichinella zimbabwensis TaxID=268475 RepID=A0A0V1GYY7_9BILA|nr:hypothetical protein T11_10244 [Trichinella zimbabwensis]